MSNHLRVWLPGDAYFFTLNLLERRCGLLVWPIYPLHDVFRATKASGPFHLLAIVVLPDNLHCLWQLPEGEADNTNRWSQINTGFSSAWPMERHSTQTNRAARGAQLAHPLFPQSVPKPL